MPWIGYFHKIALSDFFVVMDNMEFTRPHWINRTRIVQGGRPLLISLPVRYKGSSRNLINEIILDQTKITRSMTKLLMSFHLIYRGRPGFKHFFPHLEIILSVKHNRLFDLDLAMIRTINAYLGINTPIVIASEKGIGGRKKDELFFSILEHTGCNTILLGMGASRNYIDREALEAKGYKIALQSFVHPQYDQASRSFLQGVSIADMLLNMTRDEACEIFNNAVKYGKEKL